MSRQLWCVFARAIMTLLFTLFTPAFVHAQCVPPEISGPIKYYYTLRLASVPSAWTYQWGISNGKPLLDDCTVALADDDELNVFIDNASTVTPSIRVTLPSGTVRTNSWTSPVPPVGNIAFRDPIDEPGQRKIDVMTGSTVTHTKYVFVKPYSFDKISGDSQVISTASATPDPIKVRVLNTEGKPVGNHRVNFTIKSQPKGSGIGSLGFRSGYFPGSSTNISALTDPDGTIAAFLSAGKAGTYTIEVSTTKVLAPLTFTVAVVGTADPVASSTDLPKSLGLEAVQGGGCGRATTGAFTENPINIATGNKLRAELDYLGAGPFPLKFVRYYNSMDSRKSTMGTGWRHSYDRSVKITTSKVKGQTATVAQVSRPDGALFNFTLTNGNWAADADVTGRLTGVAGSTLTYTCDDDVVEEFDSNGRLQTLSARGRTFTQTVVYDPSGRIDRVLDAFGRMISFTYDGQGRLSTMKDPAGDSYSYGYDFVGNLANVTYPDLKQRAFGYGDSRFPSALTSITNENNVAWANYTYDGQGRAVSSAIVGGAKSATLSYFADGTRSVTNGNGAIKHYGFSVVSGVPRRTSVDNGACLSCGTAAMLTTYYPQGFVNRVTDFRGTVTEYTRDPRGLELTRTEALGTPYQRTITTTWHPIHRVPMSIAKPGQTQTFTYDTAGRIKSRTVTDTATNASRTWTYAYNARGLLETIDGPRTDVSDVTSFAYDADGNLATQSNALNQTTRYTLYDRHGRLRSMTDPNGLVTTFGYNYRGLLTSRNAGGQETTFTYYPTGEPLRTTMPDGSWLERQYDAAMRFTGTTDSGGHRVVYTLDSEGNRLAEQHFGPSGATYLRRFDYDEQNRLFHERDSLDRVVRTYAYDLNGNRLSESHASGAVRSSTYDPLDRVETRTDGANGLTRYAYDPRDNLIRVTDPVNVVTSYTFDGLDNLRQEASGNSGTSNFGYDTAGNLTSRTWANGKTVSRSFDALDRVRTESYDGSTQVSYAYDSGPYAIGRLSGVADPAGTTAWGYDPWGHVTSKLRDNLAGRRMATYYGWDGYGRLANMVYPSGRVLGYAFDAGGRVAAISVDGAPLVGNIAWQPFGPAKSWLQGNGRSVTRSFSLDGRMTAQDFEGGARTIGYDPDGRINAIDAWGANNAFGYDNADRLNAQTHAGESLSYVYDANGNRITKTTPAGQTSYGYVGNRLQALSGTEIGNLGHDAAGNLTSDGPAAFVYDARNRLAQVPGASYGYDGSGLRVVKTSTIQGMRHYAHGLKREVLGEYDNAAAIYETVYLGATPVAVMKNGANHWIDADQIDSPRVVRNAQDQIVWRWNSEAFGSTPAEENPSGFGGFEFNPRFPGQVFDRETGLHYNDQRDYAPSLGRYVESDPIGLAGGINTYGYVLGNPLSYVDPRGLDNPGMGPYGDRWTSDVEVGVRTFFPLPLRYVRHCFVRFNGDDNDTLSFTNHGVGADANPSGQWFLNPHLATEYSRTLGAANDACVRREMGKCEGKDYDFTKFNCCMCVSNALEACDLANQGDWPNWPRDASNPPYVPPKKK